MRDTQADISTMTFAIEGSDVQAQQWLEAGLSALTNTPSLIQSSRGDSPLIRDLPHFDPRLIACLTAQ